MTSSGQKMFDREPSVGNVLDDLSTKKQNPTLKKKSILNFYYTLLSLVLDLTENHPGSFRIRGTIFGIPMYC